MNQFLVTLFLTIISLEGCKHRETFSESRGSINYETVTEISITINRADQYLIKLISDKDSIKTFVRDLNESEDGGPWKGAKWDEIILTCNDTTIRLSTNGKVFGTGSSGIFFKLNSRYKNLWDNQTSLKVGDCFSFKDGINEFGLLLIEMQNVNGQNEYAFAPVKLDSTKSNFERFTNGRIFIGNYSNADGSRTEGLNVFHFLNQKDFETINKNLSNEGHLTIKQEFLNITGGTISLTTTEMKTTFQMWEKAFGSNARLASVEEIRIQ